MLVKNNEEFAVDDFTLKLLELLNFHDQGRLVRTHRDINLCMCGQYTYVKTDVPILNSYLS
ncbi:unnamed protein product [Cunninghamella echinulata]